MNDYSDFTEPKTTGSDNTLQTLKILGKEWFSNNAQLEKAEDFIKKLKQRNRSIETDIIPALMQDEQAEAVTVGGIHFETCEKIRASLVKTDAERRKRVFDYLVENERGGAIKTVVTIEFAPDEMEECADAVAELEQKFPGCVSLKQDINHMTYGKLCRELVSEGKSFPVEDFGVQQYQSTKITLKK